MTEFRRTLLLLVVILVACRQEDDSWNFKHGTKYPYWKAGCVDAGMTGTRVVELLGRPGRIATVNGKQRWSYEQTRSRTSTTRVFLLVPIKQTHEEQFDTQVELVNGRVVGVQTSPLVAGCRESEGAG
jgi:outer membrane protein assembly factor BamE (lipoprotein component of BamABCDE complex)